MFHGPERRLMCLRTLAALVRHTGDTDGLLVDADERRGGVEQVECVTELHVLRAMLFADVERGTDFLHFFLGIGGHRPGNL